MVHCSLKKNELLRDVYTNASGEKALLVRLWQPREVPGAECQAFLHLWPNVLSQKTCPGQASFISSFLSGTNKPDQIIRY